MNFFNGVLGIVKIDNQIFKEIEKDNSSTIQGVIIALLAGCINSLAAKNFFADVPISILIFLWVLINLYFLSFIMNFLGQQTFPEGKPKNKYKNLLRLIGYSYTPELAKILLVFYPDLIRVISLGTFIWVIACQGLAIKIIFNFKSFWKSLGIVILSYLIQIFTVVVFIYALLLMKI